MDPKLFLEIGQTNGKNVSGKAPDTSGENAKQAGRAFKEAFNTANAAENFGPKVTTFAQNVDSKVTGTEGNLEPMARDLTAKAPIDNKVPEAAQSPGHGKSLPHFQETGNLGSPEGKVGSEVTLASEVTANAGKAEVNSQSLIAATVDLSSRDAVRSVIDLQVPTSESTATTQKSDGAKPYAPHAESAPQPLDKATDKARSVRVKTTQGFFEIALPNGSASFTEVADLVKSQSLPNRFIKQVLGGFNDEPVGASINTILSEQMTAAGGAVEADSQSSKVEFLSGASTAFEEASLSAAAVRSPEDRPSAFADSRNYGPEPEVRSFNQIQNLVNSKVFTDQLALSLAPKYEGNPLKQQSVEVDHSEVTALIKRTLSSTEGYETKVKIAVDGLSNEAIKIRGAVIEAINVDKSVKLSDFDVDKLAKVLEPKFFSTFTSNGNLGVKAQPQLEAIRAAQIPRAGNFWSINDDGDLTAGRIQSDSEYRLGVSFTGATNEDRPRQTEFDSSIVAAQKFVGRSTDASTQDRPRQTEFDSSIVAAQKFVGRSTDASTQDRPRQTEFDSSIIAAQKFIGRSTDFQSSSHGKFETLDVETPSNEKRLTSADALNLRNFVNIRGTDVSPTAQPLSGSPSVAPVSTESQKVSSLTPSSSALVDQASLNSFASNGTSNPLVSGSTNSEGFRANQYQSNFQPVRDAFAMSERFTQVLTERLVQNVKSGNYNLRFNVHPRELGAVDIAMEVRDGRLDAQISSTNPITRDLLSESLPRLRDALQAGGLQLSNLEVNDNARDNQQRELMSSQEHDHVSVETNETTTNLLVEDLTLDAESVDYLA